ncbi:MULTISPECIES: glycosyltransferase family 2 protein [unclassified Leucobacter]|uniref:glycosyltransferase family 2 protein n=1 Tax=unclassified Leucobacter TaxID=2621730 RepID=UPI00165E57A7|nr:MULTISPECIES: glycosyltransferase family 2 protein [unclassified Leucobacter]MBC9936615.1 glycosyltransferase [Leucobacter sp. cx-87]
MTDDLERTDLIPGLLSVVVPIGRVDQWLDEAIASVLDSDAANFEIITVFNNGAEVPTGWVYAKDERVRVLSTTASLGPGGAGQAGIDAARGEYLVCLDADDVMRPDRLRLQQAWLQGNPETVLVSSQVDWIDERSRRIGKFALPQGVDVRPQLVKLNVAPHSSWMARMSAVRSAGGYDLTMNQMEDYDLLLRLGLLGPIAVLPKTLTDYRLHAAQLSRAVLPNGRYVRIIARQRRALGVTLGLSRARIFRARVWWEAQQWMMYVGRRVRG